MLKGHVFKKQIFGNHIFALFINTFLNGRNGISNNYKDGMAITYSGNTLTVQSGAICIQGRFLEEDTYSNIDAGTEDAYCKLVIEIDLDKENTDIEFVQGIYKIVKSKMGYPTLVQDNIAKNNAGIYQYELARFKNSTSGITEFQDMRTYLDFDSIYTQIETEYKSILEELEQELKAVQEGNVFKILQNNIENESSERQDADINLKAQIDSLASGSPLVANSVSEMTDTSRVYVNTSNGHWYYHDGTAWLDGGVYQSTGIADNYITDNMVNSIDYNKVEPQSLINDLSGATYWNDSNAVVTGGVRKIVLDATRMVKTNAGAWIPQFKIDKTKDLYIYFESDTYIQMYLYNGTSTYVQALKNIPRDQEIKSSLYKLSASKLQEIANPRFLFATDTKEVITITNIYFTQKEITEYIEKDLYTKVEEITPYYDRVKVNDMQTRIIDWTKQSYGDETFTNIFNLRNFDIKAYNIGNTRGYTSPLFTDLSKKLIIEFDGEVYDGYELQVYIAKSNLTEFNRVGGTSKTGHTKIEIDLPYHAIYNNYSDFYVWFLIAAPSNAGSATVTAIKIRNFKFYFSNISDLGIFSDNLEDMLKKIDSNLSQNQNAITNRSVIQGIDEKYVLQAGTNKSLQLVPVIPSKTLFIGNSLLFANSHGDYSFGMCASNIEADYYYHVSQYIIDKKSTATFEKMSGTSFESATEQTTVTSFLSNVLLPKLSSDLELVIVQLGDNVNTSSSLEIFKKSCVELLRYIRANAPNARVCWVGEWYSSTEKQKIIAKACNNSGCTFIDISDLNTSKNQSSVGQIITYPDGYTEKVENTGVASHPGNNGMLSIANRIIENLFEVE